MFTCLYCEKSFSNGGGLATHQPYCKLNPSRIQKINSPKAGAKKGRVPWNKGLTKDTDSRVLNNSISVSKSTLGKPGRVWTHEQRVNHSEWAKKHGNGGYKPGAGKGKSGRYKGIWCDSSWELAYVIYCLDHNIDIKRNTEKRSYLFEGKQRNYIPDFIVDTKLVEIKGFSTPQWEAKIKQNPDINVFYEKEMKPILDYVISIYGKNFIEQCDKTGVC